MGIKAPVTDRQPRELPPEGNYLAVCNGVYMLGTQPGYNNKPPQMQLMLSFELHKRKGPARNAQGQICEASAIMSMVFNAKPNWMSNLTRYAGILRGAEYDEEECKKLEAEGGFDPEKLLGLPCRLSIKHERKADGSLRDKIDSISRLDPEDDVPPEGELDEVYWDWTLGTDCPKRIAYFWDRAAENPRAGKAQPVGAGARSGPSDVDAVDDDSPPF